MTRRVLFLTHRVPYPPDRGDRIRSYHLLRHLAERFDVALGCVSDEPVTPDQRRELAALASRLAILRIGPVASAARGGAALLTGGAMTPAMLHRRRLARQIARWHAESPFDAVLTFCTGMIEYARPLLTGPIRPRHVLDLVDVDSRKWARYAQSSRPPMRWVYGSESRRLALIERDAPADAITVISDAERRTYHRHVGASDRVHVVGNGVDGSYFAPLEDSPDPILAFVGVLDYKPNVDGIVWFARQVMPLIRGRRPDATLLIVGRNVHPAVARLGGSGVEVIGPAADVRTYLARAAVVVAPLHIAPGVQNKVLEAMASRRAVVCTAAAAAGIDATAGEHLLVADDPPAFADKVVQLLADPAMRIGIADAARRRIESRYTWQAALAPMEALLRGDSSRVNGSASFTEPAMAPR